MSVMHSIDRALADLHTSCHLQVCISNKEGCPAWQYAESFGIPTLQWPEAGSEQGGPASAEQLLHALERTYKADFVILAGFMKVNNKHRRQHEAMRSWSAASGHSSCLACSAQLLYCLPEGSCFHADFKHHNSDHVSWQDHA